jgi:hypothetical protein
MGPHNINGTGGGNSEYIRSYMYCVATTGTPAVYLYLYGASSSADVPGTFLDVAGPFTPSAGWYTLPTLQNFGYLYGGIPLWLMVANASPLGGTITWRAGGCVQESAYDVLERYMKVGYYDPALPFIPQRSLEALANVVVFDIGGIKYCVGNPYVDRRQPTYWLQNYFYFGNRLKFETDTYVSGVQTDDWYGSWIGAYGIFTTAGSLVHGQPSTYHSETVVKCWRHDPILLAGGTYYDFVFQKSGGVMNGTVATIPGSPPADVLACKPPNVAGFVEGGTPGAFTLDPDAIAPISIICDSVDPPSGGGARMIG